MDRMKKEDFENECKGFFSFYKKKIGQSIRESDNVVFVNFSDLAGFSPKLSEALLENPEEVITKLEISLEEMGLVKNPRIRFYDLPENVFIKIRDIRAKHLGKFIWIEGIVRQASDVRPQVVSAKFECPSCGAIISVLQLEKKFKEPSRCSCGRKGFFKLVAKDMVDAQRLVIEESPESLIGGEQPRRLNVFLKEDLVEPKMEERTTPGSKARVLGMLNEVPVPLQTGSISTRFDLAVDANNIIPLEETYTDLKISEEDEMQIKELSMDPNVFKKLADNIAPSIYGYDEIKQAIVLQLFGGVKKIRGDGTPSRGDIHILLVGDPGVAKSVTLGFIAKMAPKGRYVVGKSASGAGLCVAPESIILTNPGGMESIESIVESRLKIKEEFKPGVWKQDNVNDIKIQSLSNDLKLQARFPSSIWKLNSPERLYEVILSSGKKIKLTGNTQLLSIKQGKLVWKKSLELKEGEHIATPRKLVGGNVSRQYCLDLISSNPVVHNIKPFVKELVKKLQIKHGSIRKAARFLNISESQLYYNWVNENVRGNIKLNQLKKIANDLGIEYRDVVREISLYNGRNHKFPLFLSKELIYIAGLVAGDGDIRKGNTLSVRFSNSDKELHRVFREVLHKEFDLKCDVQKASEKRPESARTNSKIAGEVFISLGIPISPKSNKIKMSNTLLHLSDELLAEYIAGLYDTDGSICTRKTKGSDCIEFTTCSEKLARQIQLVFLRFGIHANLRRRSPSIGVIKGNYDKWVLSITGIEQIRQFYKHFKLRHLEKKRKLELLTSRDMISNTNLDVVPGISDRLKKELKNQSIPLKSGCWHPNLSRKYAQRISNLLKDTEEAKDIKDITFSDIYWEKIKSIRDVGAETEYVYDLTVEDSHNFVVDGVLVHNTATVVRDEFLKGWSLEAGAMVLSHKGILCIDEIEKMDPQDRSSMHEALEQQCMLPDFKLMLSNGKGVKIGELVDDLMEKNKKQVYQGKDCEILPVDNLDLLSTDFQNHFSVKASRVSKHLAPKDFIKITLTNGREITVTPEHPCWVIKDGKIITVSAETLNTQMHFPIPSKLDTLKKEYKKKNDYLCKILGYHLSDGCYELNRGKKTGIQFWNNDDMLIQDYKKSIEKFFNIKPIITKRNHQFAVRVISKKIVEEFNKLDKMLLEKGDVKKIPNEIMQFPNASIKYLLRALFDGDGTVVFQKRNGCRISLSSQNRELIEQVSDLLLRFEITSSIFRDKIGNVWLLDISGQENLSRFLVNISFLSQHKKQRLKEYCEKNKSYKTIKDVIPGCTNKISEIFKKLKISCKKEIGHSIDLGVEKQRLFLQKLILVAEKRLEQLENRKDFGSIKQDLDEIKKLAFGYARWMKIKEVLKIPNKEVKWVYDVTVEPYHTFISNGMILHNTVTISKANVQATLRAETSVLAAGNPKFGRFDPYMPIAQQVDIQPTLLNRFDVIFMLRDLPDKNKDDAIASHVLKEHQTSAAKGNIDPDLFRKYVAYAKQKIVPKLSDEAVAEIKNFYVTLRNAPSAEESAVKPIPITARQIGAMIRLAEASAKTRLSEVVEKRDAEIAINILKYYLMQAGYDYETKSFDIDKITSGITASKRGKIMEVKSAMLILQDKIGKLIPREEIEKHLEGKVSRQDLEDAIEKLSISGDIFCPKKGYIQLV